MMSWEMTEEERYPMRLFRIEVAGAPTRDGVAIIRSHSGNFARDRARARLIAAAPDLLDSIDPDTLDAIADEIDCFEHSARAGSLRYLAKRQRAALAKASS